MACRLMPPSEPSGVFISYAAKTELRSPSINGDFSINDYCYESVYSAVLKLHHLTPFSCQLSQRLGFSAFCSMAIYFRPPS
jgi:hypothetical protein